MEGQVESVADGLSVQGGLQIPLSGEETQKTFKWYVVRAVCKEIWSLNPH